MPADDIIPLASVELVMRRHPRATKRSVEAVLYAVGGAIPYASAGDYDQALAALYSPIFAFEAPLEIDAWFEVNLIAQALRGWSAGDRRVLPAMLQVYGLHRDEAPPATLQQLREHGLR